VEIVTSITAEEFSNIMNIILLGLSTGFGFLVVKFKPQITDLTMKIAGLNTDILILLEVINRIKSLVVTCEAATQDQNISQEEAEKILKEVKELTESEDIKRLLKDFGL
jgi:hypothetical protein